MRMSPALALTALLALPHFAVAELIAYYTFEGNANNVAPGHVGSANGVPSNGPTLGAGYQGQAYHFDGADDFIQIDGLDINPAVLPKLTMGAWVKSEFRDRIQQVISHDNGGYDRSLGIDARGASDGQYNFSTFSGNYVLNSNQYSSGWTLLTTVYDQTAPSVTYYVNGSFAGSSGTGEGPGWGFTRIGASPSFTEYFQGYIDDVFFFDEALTAGQIAAIYTQGIHSHLTGDTNDDGVVDLADLNNVLNNFGSHTPGNVGDDNDDNAVDLQDLNNVLNNFGAHAGASALSVVPEPAGLGVALCAVVALRRRRVRG